MEIEQLQSFENRRESRLCRQPVRVHAVQEARDVDVPGARRWRLRDEIPFDDGQRFSDGMEERVGSGGIVRVSIPADFRRQHRTERMAHQPAGVPSAPELIRGKTQGELQHPPVQQRIAIFDATARTARGPAFDALDEMPAA